jgi:hypothetical protein
MRHDGRPVTNHDFRELHNRIAAFDDVEWIESDAREIVERVMPDLVGKLSDRTTKTLDKAFGRKRASAAREHLERRKRAMSRSR